MSKESTEPIVLTASDVVAAPPALIRVGLDTLPAAIAAAGAHTSERVIEFFTANIRNRNTRMAYALALRQFFDWCEDRGLPLGEIRPTTVAAYIEQRGAGMAKPSVKQHFAVTHFVRPALRPTCKMAEHSNTRSRSRPTTRRAPRI